MKFINNIKLYSEKELAVLLGINGMTVAKYRKEGQIKATRIGRGYYYSEAALNEYLSGRISRKAEERELGKLFTR